MTVVLEREDLLSQLSDLVDQASAGTGSMALVAGEAGAGKTTLVGELVAGLPKNITVLKGYCDPLSTPRPLGPLRDIAEAADAGLDDITEFDQPIEVFGAVLDRLKRTMRPVLMVIEDIHWADAATLDMLTFLGRRVSAIKGVIITTFRADELSLDHPLRPVIADLATKPSVFRYEVPMLSLGAVHQLAEGGDVDPAMIHQTTGGNAFYVTELLAAGGGMPVTVQEAVLARVGRLDPAARSVAEVVSIAPRSMELSHVVALVGPAATEGAEVATRAGVLVGDRNGYRFRHELARLAVEDSIPLPRRVELNRRMLALLEASGDAARLAHHACNTFDPETILAHVPTAAREAMERHSHTEAASWFEEAHPFIEDLLPEDRSAFLSEFWLTLSVVNRQERGLQIAEELVALANEIDEPVRLGDAMRVLSRALWLVGRVEESNAAIGAAVDLLSTLGNTSELAQALYIAANNQMLDRHYEDGLRLSEWALSASAAIEDTAIHVRALQCTGTIELVMGDVDRGIDLIERSISLGRSNGHPRVDLVGYSMLGTGGGEVRIYDRASGWLDAAIALAVEQDEDFTAAYATSWSARIKCERGEWDDAARLANRVSRHDPSVAPIVPLTALGTLGRVRVRRGDPGGEEVLRTAIELGVSAALQHLWVSFSTLAEMYWLRGESERALSSLDEFHSRILETDTSWGRGEVSYWMWRNGGLADPPDNMARPFALMIAGNWESAAEAWDQIGCPYEQALALADGDVDARMHALTIFDGLGARPAGLWLRQQLRNDGVESIPRGPRDTTKNHPDGLTARQSEVLGLIEQGLGNADIARRLFISQKTVDHHVSAVLSKLHATNRGELIARAAGHIVDGE